MKTNIARNATWALILLTIIFCILKITNVISISWVSCFFPVLIPIGILTFFFILMIIGALLIYLFTQS